MIRCLAVALILPAVVALGGCDGFLGGATPTPPPLSRVQAAEAFNDVVERYEEAVGEVGSDLGSEATFEEQRDALAELIPITEEFLGDLDEIRFPEDVRDEAQALREVVEEALEAERRAVEAQNEEALTRGFAEILSFSAQIGEAAEDLRTALGIEDEE